MAVPVLEFDETNGAGAAVTANIPNIVFASQDLPSTTANLTATAPILVGSLSFEKWIRAKVTTAATNSLNNFTVSWAAQAIQDAAGATGTVDCKYGVNGAYPAGGPVNTASAVATTECQGAGPTALNAPANAAGAYSGYITAQLALQAACAGGDIVFPTQYLTLGFQYS